MHLVILLTKFNVHLSKTFAKLDHHTKLSHIAIVSDGTRLEHRLSELTAFLIARGNSKPAVEEQLEKRRLGTNRTALVCTWNTRLPEFSELLRDSFPILQSNEHLRSVFDFPLVSYRRPRNLRDLLVSPSTEQSRKARAPQPDGTFSCDKPRCKTCERVHTIATLPYGTDWSISIRGHHSCQSSSAVYLISCTQAQCDAVYIGETGCTLREDEWPSFFHQKQWRHARRSPLHAPRPLLASHSSGEGANWHRAASTPRKAVDQQAERVPVVYCAEPRRWPWHPSAVNSNVILSVLYFLCQLLHFSFSPCACVNPISSFLLLPLLLVLPYLAPVQWCLGTDM